MKRRHLLGSLLGGGSMWPLRAAEMRPRALVFPGDFGAHDEQKTEWWYLTGWLASGERLFGFQVTFFRSRTPVPADHPSRFAARQLVFAHSAVSNIREGRLRHDQRIARAGFGIAEASPADTRVRLRDWSLQRDAGAAGSRYRALVPSDAAGFRLDLALAASHPPLLQGEAGYSRKGPGPSQATFYYSEPQLDATGTLTLDGRALAVRGRAWLDHEWGDSVLDPDAMGWDWIGMNLDDGSALTAFRLRRADGSTLYAGGSLRGADGALRTFGPGEVRFTAGRRWRSPVSRAEYPVEWAVETPAGTHTVRALFDAQELDSRQSTGAFYWEGLGDLLDPQGTRVGRGYLEMTGYAARLPL